MAAEAANGLKPGEAGARGATLFGALRARLCAAYALRLLAVLTAACALAFLAVVAGDAVAVLPEPLRVAAPGVLLGLALVALVVAALLGLRRLDSLGVARRFERKMPALGNALTNAVQLASQPSETAVGEILRAQAVEQGRRCAKPLSAWALEERPALWAGLALVAVTALWGGGWAAFPDVFEAVLPRFLDPRGDHPPYSRLRVQVDPPWAEVRYGGQVELRAITSGIPADKLFLVARQGARETQVPMFMAAGVEQDDPARRTFFQTLSQLREPTVFYATDGRARSVYGRIEVRFTPLLSSLEMTAHYPAYTGRRSRALKLKGELALPEGTRIECRATSNRPLAKGTVVLTPLLGGAATTVELRPNAGGGEVRGEFTVTAPVVYRVGVSDVDGLESTDSRGGRFTILPDRRPTIAVLEPGRHAVATPDVAVPVHVRAEDDYGVASILWYRRLNGSTERFCAMPLKLSENAEVASAESAGAFSLAQLGVRPGDTVEYFFEAVDNYPGGPNVATSRLFRLTIISTEQYREILRRAAAQRALFQHYRQLDAWIRRLAERSRVLDEKGRAAAKDGALPERERAALEGEWNALRKDLAEYHEALGKALQQPELFDLDSALKERLAEHHQKIGELTKALARAGSGGTPAPSLADLGGLRQALAEFQREQSQRVGEPVRHVQSVAELLSRARLFTVLAERQSELAHMTERFKSKSGVLSRVEQMELQELARVETGIREALRQLMDDLPKLLGQLPEDASYDKLRATTGAFIEAVENAFIDPELASAGRLLAELNGGGAYPPARSAADKMDALVKKCGVGQMEGLGQQGLAFQPQLSDCLGNTLQQILQALGSGEGQGQGGQDGYSMFSGDVGLYGPGAEMARNPEAGGEGDGDEGRAQSRHERLRPDAPDGPDAERPGTPPRIRLTPNDTFPLRYRDLVGDYFRAIAEMLARDGGDEE